MGGWNCRHSFFPYFEGISEPAYTRRELEELQAKKYTYNGQRLTEYEASQQQRGIERQIRRWKREYAAMEAAGQDTTEAAAKIRQWQDRQKNFLKQTGLKRQTDREQVPGFGKQESGKAVHDAKILKMMQEDSIIKKNSNLPKKVAASDEILQTTVGLETIGMNGIVPKGAKLTHVYTMAGYGTSVQVKDWKRLYNQYGGDPSKWQKKIGTVTAANYRYEIHWYEREGVQIEAKPKGGKRL